MRWVALCFSLEIDADAHYMLPAMSRVRKSAKEVLAYLGIQSSQHQQRRASMRPTSIA